MLDKSKPSFAFLVLAFNHQEYVIEHLESIKYLVKKYGVGLDIDIVVNDDFSSDRTLELIVWWLSENGNLFRFIKIINNNTNLGTCASMNNMLDCMVADRCKITAGDDVYSYVNIFALTEELDHVGIISGKVLYLFDNQVVYDWKTRLFEIASDVLYKDQLMSVRFENISYNNAPNIYYATSCLKNPNVRSYFSKFQVTEDWPLQLAISENFRNLKFELINETLVYYRRTIGSTYLVASEKFKSDKYKIYDDLIEKQDSIIGKARLKIRKHLFAINGRWIKRILNFDLYIFLIRAVLKIRTIRIAFNLSMCRLDYHQCHYVKIKKNAKATMSKFTENGNKLKKNKSE
jgi:hypothetical protein